MARSTISTLLPLDTWAAIMGVNPWEFNQVGEGFPVANMAQCPYVWFQYPWQQDFLSREELARAIGKAEQMLANHLNYWPAPKYLTDEPHPYPAPFNNTLYGYSGTPRGQWKAVRLNYGKIQAGGLMARSAIQAGAAIVLSDNDGDTVNDRFTITVPTALTDPAEIAVYFAAADRNNVAVTEAWRIRPVDVTISGGNAVITGHPSLLVKPDLTTVVNPSTLNVTTAANFVTTADVYRLYTDDRSTTASPSQGKAFWADPDCNTVPCTDQWLPVCLGNRNAEAGMVTPDYWQNGLYCPPSGREPDRLLVNYVAGEPLVNGHMNDSMADVVAHLATALLPVRECGCAASHRIIAYWQDIESFQTKGMVPATKTPFGAQRGAVYAWERVQELAIGWVCLG